jgi:hypothetical protein
MFPTPLRGAPIAANNNRASLAFLYEHIARHAYHADERAACRSEPKSCLALPIHQRTHRDMRTHPWCRKGIFPRPQLEDCSHAPQVSGYQAVPRTIRLMQVGRRCQSRSATEASAPASHSGRTSADGSAGVANGGSCHAYTVDPCPTYAAGSSDFRDHVVRLKNNQRRCHGLRRYSGASFRRWSLEGLR